HPVEQKVSVKLAQGGELAGYRPLAHAVRKQLVEKVADVFSSRLLKLALARFQELRKLLQVGLIGTNAERGQAFLDFQIVEEALHPFLVFSSHASSIPVSFPVSREQIANWVRRRGTAIGVPAARGVRAAGWRSGLIVYPANSVSSH